MANSSTPIYTVNWVEADLKEPISLLRGSKYRITTERISWMNYDQPYPILPYMDTTQVFSFTARGRTILRTLQYAVDGWKSEDYVNIYINDKIIYKKNYIKEESELYFNGRGWLLENNDTLSIYFINGSKSSKIFNTRLIYGLVP